MDHGLVTHKLLSKSLYSSADHGLIIHQGCSVWSSVKNPGELSRILTLKMPFVSKLNIVGHYALFPEIWIQKCSQKCRKEH